MNLNKMIDHTLLKPDATKSAIEKICAEAITHGFASVCISPLWVPLAAHLLAGSEVKVCTVIGFPHGTATTETKAFEAEDAIAKGAQEVDMVIAIGKLKEQDYRYVLQDIKEVVAATKGRALLKVIIETCLLSDIEKVKACELAKEAGADFVKTSTGFAGGGATVADVELMRKTVGPVMGVKASGGISSKEEALTLVQAGATRLGTSRSSSIVGKN